MIRVSAIVCALLLPSAGLNAAQQNNIVPKQFRGEWHPWGEKCGAPSPDYIAVKSSGLQFYEGSFEVKKLVKRSNTIVLQGDWWDETDVAKNVRAELTLSKDHKKLTAVIGGKPPSNVFSCPAREKNNAQN